MRAFRDKHRDDGSSLVAAGVAFYGALAVIPASVIAVSMYGIFTSSIEAEAHVEALLEILPETTARTLEAQIHPLADLSHFHLTLGLVGSVVALLWTASNASRAMVRAICIAYGQRDLRSPLEARLAALGLTILVITIATVAVAVVAAVPVWLSFLDPDHVIVNFGNLRWGLIAVLVGGGITALYRVAPPSRPKTWRGVLPGALIATGLWMAISLGFSVYVSSFGRYNQTYGALGAGAVLMLWLWLSSLIVISGAQINVLRASIEDVASSTSAGP